jgi:hypothetical protein
VGVAAVGRDARPGGAGNIGQSILEVEIANTAAEVGIGAIRVVACRVGVAAVGRDARPEGAVNIDQRILEVEIANTAAEVGIEAIRVVACRVGVAAVGRDARPGGAANIGQRTLEVEIANTAAEVGIGAIRVVACRVGGKMRIQRRRVCGASVGYLQTGIWIVCGQQPTAKKSDASPYSEPAYRQLHHKPESLANSRQNWIIRRRSSGAKRKLFLNFWINVANRCRNISIQQPSLAHTSRRHQTRAAKSKQLKLQCRLAWSATRTGRTICVFRQWPAEPQQAPRRNPSSRGAPQSHSHHTATPESIDHPTPLKQQ